MKKIDKEIIAEIEADLRSYPFWLIREELSGLGTPSHYGVKTTSSSSSIVERSILDDEERSTKVKIIQATMDKFDNITKDLIEKYYFQDTYTRDELIKELKIDKNRFYNIKNEALNRFKITLNY